MIANDTQHAWGRKHRCQCSNPNPYSSNEDPKQQTRTSPGGNGSTPVPPRFQGPSTAHFLTFLPLRCHAPAEVAGCSCSGRGRWSRRVTTRRPALKSNFMSYGIFQTRDVSYVLAATPVPWRVVYRVRRRLVECREEGLRAGKHRCRKTDTLFSCPHSVHAVSSVGKTPRCESPPECTVRRIRSRSSSQPAVVCTPSMPPFIRPRFSSARVSRP